MCAEDHRKPLALKAVRWEAEQGPVSSVSESKTETEPKLSRLCRILTE